MERKVAAWEMDKRFSVSPTWRVELIDTGDHYAVREFGMFKRDGALATTRMAKGFDNLRLLKRGTRGTRLYQANGYKALLPHDEAALMWAGQVIERTIPDWPYLRIAMGPPIPDTFDPLLMINFTGAGCAR